MCFIQKILEQSNYWVNCFATYQNHSKCMDQKNFNAEVVFPMCNRLYHCWQTILLSTWTKSSNPASPKNFANWILPYFTASSSAPTYMSGSGVSNYK